MNIRPKINANLELEKNNQKLPENFDLGGSWASFGKGLGRSWASSGRSWATFVRILDVQNLAFFKHGSNMGAKRPFGSILGGSWKDLGRVWGWFGVKFGRIWTFFSGCGHFLAAFGKMWPCCGKASKLDPRADPRSVTIRPPPGRRRVGPG